MINMHGGEFNHPERRRDGTPRKKTCVRAFRSSRAKEATRFERGRVCPCSKRNPNPNLPRAAPGRGPETQEVQTATLYIQAMPAVGTMTCANCAPRRPVLAGSVEPTSYRPRLCFQTFQKHAMGGARRRRLGASRLRGVRIHITIHTQLVTSPSRDGRASSGPGPDVRGFERNLAHRRLPAQTTSNDRR